MSPRYTTLTSEDGTWLLDNNETLAVFCGHNPNHARDAQHVADLLNEESEDGDFPP